MEEQEPERYYEWMLWKMRKEDNKLKKGKSMIWVTFQKEGIHKYPAALEDPKLATGDEYDVSFLGHPHRHIFHFKVFIEVFHDDRDIEFIQFKRWLEKLNTEKTLQLDYKSCEMIADDLNATIQKRYQDTRTDLFMGLFNLEASNLYRRILF